MPDLPSRLTAALAHRYRIERELGAGGMATVYLAEDPKHQRQVAIEVLWSSARELFAHHALRLFGSGTTNFDIHPEGTRFFTVAGPRYTSMDSEKPNSLATVEIVVNWFEELKARMGEGGR